MTWQWTRLISSRIPQLQVTCQDHSCRFQHTRVFNSTRVHTIQSQQPEIKVSRQTHFNTFRLMTCRLRNSCFCRICFEATGLGCQMRPQSPGPRSARTKPHTNLSTLRISWVFPGEVWTNSSGKSSSTTIDWHVRPRPPAQVQVDFWCVRLAGRSAARFDR